MITKEELRDFLNRRGINFYTAVDKATRFVMQEEVKEKIIRYVGDEVKKKKKPTSNDFLILFINIMSPVVKGTNLCTTTYGTQMFLKNVWQTSRIQSEIVNYIKKPKPPVEKKELTVQEKRVLQAKRMREAKARKAKQRKALELVEKNKAKAQDKPEVKEESKPKITVKGEELSKEELAQIELLRKLNT